MTAIHNETLDHIFNHKTIRKFKPTAVTPDQLTALYHAAQQTPTSMFLQQFSIVRVTDETKRAQIREICGQDYVGAEGELLIFVVDLHRNAAIREQLGNDIGRLDKTDLFLQGVEDTTLAVQNTVTAAESMGLGTVILGSIQNDLAQMVKILALPSLTLPLLGLQVGVPDQKPQLKPRLPQQFVVFENTYPKAPTISELAPYDQVVTTYYDLRDSNRRIDSFTHQINGAKLARDKSPKLRHEIAQVIKQQGFAQDF